nr:reverse transcriptase domain-containing protein [Tanacetum cinerariifolium]
MARIDAMTMKMDAQYKDFQSRSKQSKLDDDDIPMSREEESKFMQTFCRTCFNNDYRDRDSNRDNWRSSGRNDYNQDNYQSYFDEKPDLQKQLNLLTSNLVDLLDLFRLADKHVNAVFTQSGKSYDPPDNPNDQQNNFETPINFDSDDEPTPQPKRKAPKPVKETPTPKPYKPKIPYPQHIKKEKMEAQYGKFLNLILSRSNNVPLVDVLAKMPNYGKFLKELINSKHKIKQISAAFLSDESFTILQNKVPPKLEDPRSFLIPCYFNKAFSSNALADLGASIYLMRILYTQTYLLKLSNPLK